MTPPERPVSAFRATLGRWLLAAVMGVGALALLLRPGGVAKVLALVLAAGAVTTLARRDRSSATIIAVVLLAIAAVFVVSLLSGNSQWIIDRYTNR